jgi:membrane protein DedA with SNARE-associated domain
MTEVLIQYVEWGAELGRTWGPVIVLLLMAVESSFIPFPSEIVMLPAGFMAARSEFVPTDQTTGLIVAVMAGLFGSLLGAFVNYGLSLRLGRPFLYRYGRFLFLSPPALERAEEVFRRHGEITTFVCRLIPAVRQLISIPAGLSRMRPGRFALFTGLGAGIWVLILALVGFALGTSTQQMSYEELVYAGEEAVAGHLVWILLGILVIVSLYVWAHRRFLHGRPALTGERESP